MRSKLKGVVVESSDDGGVVEDNESDFSSDIEIDEKTQGDGMANTMAQLLQQTTKSKVIKR
jgi:hypothetical protein